MKGVIGILASISLLLFSFGAHAITDPTDRSFAPIQWVSSNSNDAITIENGTAVRIVVQINLPSNGSPNRPGINIKNCGNTTHLSAGSTAICFSTDVNNPVTFSSDSGSAPASGTYQIKQLLQ